MPQSPEEREADIDRAQMQRNNPQALSAALERCKSLDDYVRLVNSINQRSAEANHHAADVAVIHYLRAHGAEALADAWERVRER